MVIQLQSQHVSLMWPAIKEAIINIEGIKNQELLNNALNNFLSGKYQIWIGYDFDSDGNQVIYGIAVTGIIKNEIFEYKSLQLIYVYAFRKPPSGMREEAIRSFFKFAKNNSCREIIADSDNSIVESILDRYKFNKTTKYKFILG